jgi:hypothetical protein
VPGPARAGAAGKLEALLVPGLHRVALLEDPGPRLRDHLLRRGGEFLDDPRLVRLGRVEVRALHHQHERLLGADHARQALRPAGARQQAHLHLGQADLRLRVVQRDAVMAGQAQLEAAAERRAVDGRDQRLAAGLQLAEQQREAARVAVDLLRVLHAREHADQVLEVGPGDEAVLGRGDHHALHGRVAGERLDGLAQFAHELRRQHVHRPPGDVDDQQRDAVLVHGILECLSHDRDSFRRARGWWRCPCPPRRRGSPARWPGRAAPSRRAACRAPWRRWRRAGGRARSRRR